MPYLIRVIYGRETKVIRLFAREGVELTRIPVSEYLIGCDPRCLELRHKDSIEGYIINVSEITSEDIVKLRAQDVISRNDDAISIGNIVMITEGVYKGQNGVVRKSDGDDVSVDICLFGRMRPMVFKRSEIMLSQNPEVWG